MGGLAALSINDPPPTVSLSVSNFPPRPPQPKQIDRSESPGPRHMLCLRMAFVNMDAIDIYEQSKPKAGPRGEKQPPVSNGNVPAIGKQSDTRGISKQMNGRLQDSDLIEVLDVTARPPDPPLDILGKFGADSGAAGRSPHSTIRTKVDDFADMAEELGIHRGRRPIGSDTSQDLPRGAAIQRQRDARAARSGRECCILDGDLERKPWLCRGERMGRHCQF